ncbi:bifunctional ADP-dependent NAD(P)H-hydrate dehydratase/NAD(P)H-hydrate epimerase [Syntrophus aciditrophicus]|nr:bifunctional ADP-dependent NAD(P)H-hydrate dehydratase/NAD(P)H-hydrate epimerase [Syntrophus aciditrophicus]
MRVCSVQEMRAMDRYAIEHLAIPEEILMENAGLAAAAVLKREIGIPGRKFVIFCGGGNNGGDGFVVARKVFSDGGTVRVFLLADPEKFRGAARTNLDILKRLPIDLISVESAEQVRCDIRHCHGIVDAIFGTGLDRPVGGLFKEVIDLINGSGRKVLSLDIPSGVNGDTGEIMGVAVQADFTVTFGLPKIGNILYPGFSRGGKLHVCHISFPPDLQAGTSRGVLLNNPPPVPPRNLDAHKGSVGEALFIAGAANYFGAPCFAALSFLKAGGGYSRLAAPASMIPSIAQRGGEIVFVPQRETAAGSLSGDNFEELLALSAKMDMVVIGPGLSLEEETKSLVRALVQDIARPLLIDGDGITAVASRPELISERKAPTILTPHPGEMARLSGMSIQDIRRERIRILQETAANLRAIVVLKGAHSLIGMPDGRVFINLSGNPGMATAGSGDVLTGTIAAMYGQGLPLEDAVCKGVLIHGLSGDLAAEARGEDGITAQDILNFLPEARKADREGVPAELFRRYSGPEIL